MKFEDFGLSQELLNTIKRLGFTQPTQIQELTIPHIKKGLDIIGESATGSGKTLAFGCGIIDHAVPGKGLQALILTPTRELAEQVKDEMKKISQHKRLSIISIYGGVSINNQIDALPRADIVVGTPGRLLDHMQRGTMDLSNVTLLVLDEADRMLEMGFIEDVEQIIRACPRDRQTLFFSATIEQDIKRLADQYMKKPIKICARKHVDPSKLRQYYYDVEKNRKLSLLIHLLKKEESGLVMVFCNTRTNTDFVTKSLRANKIDAMAIHGGFSQNKRGKSLSTFHGGKVGVLVCTDVAARGLHIENVSHVYNYDIPKDAKDYVHRIGRTARAGEKGKVINILCQYDYDNFSRVQGEYRDFSIQKMEVPHLERVIVPRSSGRGGPRRGGFRGGKPFQRRGGQQRHRRRKRQ